tara:strand:+ start:1578 stop:2870 length:1293 start_codon:yes stop_codon:yes gene_type:complete
MYTAVSADDAVKIVKSGDRVFIHTAAAAPQELINALTNRGDELKAVELIHMHIDGKAPYADPKYKESFYINNLFIGANVRYAVEEGQASYMPIFLSEVPLLFRRNILPLDVAMIQVSPPDNHGFCSLGVSIDATKAAIDSAKHVIAQINPKMPRTHGDGLIHISALNSFVEVDHPIHVHEAVEPNAIETKIGENIAALVDDGATLQMGIGAIPNAALKAMSNHKDLGIHTEMFSDGILDLFEKGVITGKNKHSHAGKIVSGFAMGSQRLYDFMDDNPLVNMADIEWVNSVKTIQKNPKVTAINSAIEVDLTGQVCADSIGNRFYSGVGGQMDFMRGASLSEGGKPIIALPSTTAKGISRISTFLKQGAGVVTTRAHVHYVVTEYGAVNLYGKNIHQRAKALIDIAHPTHRERLYEEADQAFRLSKSVFVK